MIFLGVTFVADASCFGVQSIPNPNFTEVDVGSCIADDLYASKSYENIDTAPDTWDFDTIIHAKFNGTTVAGNIDYYVSEIDAMKLKRRKKGELNWQTIFEQTIAESDDLTFEFLDKTLRGNTTYQYVVVPVFGTVEGSFFASEVTTAFDGVFIMDSTGIYSTDLEVKISEKRTKPRNIIAPINRKYPYVISNGANNYDSGNISGFFVEKSSEGYDTVGGHMYRRSFKDFLNNDIPKLLKMDDGRMWLIEISSTDISDSEQGHRDFITTAFDWTEVGDCDNVEDLAMTGLIDI